MGQTLGAPVTIKDCGDGYDEKKSIAWGFSCMQGWRPTMEDAHFALGSLEGEWTDTAAFGVMDGHGGTQVALFCQRHLPAEISRGASRDPHSALIAAFHKMDDMLWETGETDLQAFTDASASRPGGRGGRSADPKWMGCTAVVCLVRPSVIVVANAGDSRAVLSRGRQAVPLSEDHKPNLPGERDRIRRAGGSVARSQFGSTVQHRVNGNLNLSRSIGDLEYKKNPNLQPHEQMICSTPDVHTFRREAADEFILIACDGIWDVLGSQDAVDFVHERLGDYLQRGQPLSGIMAEMLDHCLSPDLGLTQGLGGDNMTAMLLVFGEAPTDHFIVEEGELLELDPAHVLEERAIAPASFCGCRPRER